uniref:THAP-type domain-containing protein n=1 Tax=Neogobius melanostomus TaxID=47308 RepID=A0A8C6WW33_9GOBI
MTQSCCVLGCHKDRRGNFTPPLRFFSFPSWKQKQGAYVSDVTRRRRLAWVAAVNRTNVTFDSVSKYIVCSRHFIKGKPSYEMFDQDPDWAPSLHLGHGEPQSDSPVKFEKKRCMKTKRDEERMAKQKLENMISGDNFDITDLQVQHVQLLKAFGEMQTEAAKLRAENEKFEDALQSDFSKLSYRFLKCDEEQLQFLTGLHSVTFDWLVPKISRIIFRVHPEVKQQDHLLIVLMKLKLGLCDDDLGYRFQIHGGIITAMCQTWIPALAAVLSPLVAWPSQDAIVKTNPSIFTGGVRQCCCIVDTFEVTIATPNATTKVASYLIGATPAGAITFVSLGSFSRKKSDRQLIRESGFVDLLKPKDLLLTNKTLPIQKDLDAIGATLLTPDVAKGKKSGSTKRWTFLWLCGATWRR